MSEPVQKPPTIRQVALGLFVLVQLVYLLWANFTNLLCSPHVGAIRDQKLVDALRLPARKWSMWTYQVQDWTQYAPAVPHQSGFVAIELRWPNDPTRSAVKLLAEIEPADKDRFFRRFFQFRLSVYESWLSAPYWGFNPKARTDMNPEAAAKFESDWRTHFIENFRQQRNRYRDYMLWRAQEWHNRNAGAPAPQEIGLSIRLIAASLPEERPWQWHGPVEVPVTRWRFDNNWDTIELPQEMYDPFAEKFILVPQEDKR